MSETLDQPWVIIDGDFTAYACETHAREYALENGIPATAYGYALEREGYGTVSDVHLLPSWDRGEVDYPVSCECGQYLDVSLTREGHAYMLENEFPAWLYVAHNVKTDNNNR